MSATRKMMLRKLLCLGLLLLFSQPSASFQTSLLAHTAWHNHLSSEATASNHATATLQKRGRGKALWPGSRFTEDDRRRAIMRGLNFIYRTALKRRNFAD